MEDIRHLWHIKFTCGDNFTYLTLGDFTIKTQKLKGKSVNN